MSVALFTRAWIEMLAVTRAWIEILTIFVAEEKKPVALFTRAWIEISILSALRQDRSSRPLYEGVD